jgi:hypothetical protein
MGRPVSVILWSRTRRVWELWRASRPFAESASLDVLRARYPDALLPAGQIELSQGLKP